MIPKPLRIALFALGALLFLGFSAGVTQAAGKFFFGGAAGTRENLAASAGMQMGATEDPGATPDPSATPVPSATPEPSATPGAVKVEFSGVLSAMNGDLWTVGDFTVQVTPDTELNGSPVAGDFVKVEAFLLADGTYVAHEIEKEDQMGSDDKDNEHEVISTPDDDHEEHDSSGGGTSMQDDEHEDEHSGDHGSGGDDHGSGGGDHGGDHGGGGDHDGGDD